MYNPKEYWKNELGGVENWKLDARTSPNIIKGIKRMKTVFIPKMFSLKNYYGGRILDAGCGSGYCSKTFHDSKIWNEVHGIDFQQHRIDFCVENYNNINFAVGDLTTLPYEDNYFDTIYTGAVLMHLPLEDKIKAISEFKRVLNIGGFYFGHEIVNQSGIHDEGTHVINPDLNWLKEQFKPYNVEVLILHYDGVDMQIIYVKNEHSLP